MPAALNSNFQKIDAFLTILLYNGYKHIYPEVDYVLQNSDS